MVHDKGSVTENARLAVARRAKRGCGGERKLIQNNTDMWLKRATQNGHFERGHSAK